MRLRVILIFTAALAAGATSLVRANPPASLDLTGNAVDFYYNRFVVTADGNVRVRLSDGTVITGQTFSMDLKLNRYLVAGDVRVDGPSVHESGAAFAGYPDLDRSYFLPESGSPERWTYYGLNWSDRHVGREQPGDAFYFPDLTGERSYIRAAGARITPRTNVMFDQARVYTAGAYVPVPRYVVTFAANSHFYENAFAGARADVGVPFNGSAHSLTALHLRNDAFNGTYLALDQHFVWDQDWAVGSIDPLTQEQRQYNIIGYKRWSPKLETRLFVQESAGQPGIINRPINAAAYTQLLLGTGFRGSNISYLQNNYYQYILGMPAVANDSVATPAFDPRWREHPTDGVLSFTGGPTALTKGRTGLILRPRLGFGYAHDAYGYGGYPNLQPGPKTLYFHYTGGSLYTPPINLTRVLSLTGSYDRQRTWYSVAHQVDAGDLRFTIAGARERQHLRYFVAYEIKTTDDYWGSQQLAAYPPSPDVVVTPFGRFGGQAAFRGLATSRGYTSSVIYTPTPLFELNLRLARFYDYPAPVPGLYGQPPWQFSGDVRVRLSRQILLDVGRDYFFNFANERWSPQFRIQFSP